MKYLDKFGSLDFLFKADDRPIEITWLYNSQNKHGNLKGVTHSYQMVTNLCTGFDININLVDIYAKASQSICDLIAIQEIDLKRNSYFDQALFKRLKIFQEENPLAKTAYFYFFNNLEEPIENFDKIRIEVPKIDFKLSHNRIVEFFEAIKECNMY
ncbi:hypothetical protein KY334_03130 [Candidatus Woesearchaeota archaeon]|nr:hypothetical protein [Candidatus Woesearchaeota archaeon]